MSDGGHSTDFLKEETCCEVAKICSAGSVDALVLQKPLRLLLGRLQLLEQQDNS